MILNSEYCRFVCESFIPCDYDIRKFGVFFSHIYRSPELLTRVIFRASAFEIPNIDRGGACSKCHEEYADKFLQKLQPLLCFGPHFPSVHLSQSLTHGRHFLHLLTLMGERYIDHRQNPRVINLRSFH
jgi:hypothetical protein